MTSNDPVALIAESRIMVAPETYNVISIPHDEWDRIVQNPELSPSMATPFVLFKDTWEVTLIVDDQDFESIRPGLSSARVERNYRLISFDVDLEFDVVGFMAAVAKIFADAGISILPFSSFSRDHVFVSQEKIADALKALRGHVKEIC